ncbi:Uncharacterized conserved protein, DUF302 family [Dyella jiangningensis]|uniref:DUF302 domain-containing protein n=1 Tax=Dyella sp. AtDHG13 TaxID=1938897 RepID=UPI000885F8C9|nr:DUF302 domain-containing protein [Dyella sp. AtDHG13]PXV54670.1 uncharacterized protein (DUF302 family) [Dyella sp. AtDHG13]SDK89043.1 Uncharacterized conserved protein, DUF302 family [Dyella jiangningensis]
MADQPANGIIQYRSSYGVAETIERIRQALESHGITVFAHIDFSADAARAGLTMQGEQMLIFGNPKAGTPLMQQVPLAGLDLPLKVLVWDDGQGATCVACNAPEYIIARHGLPESMAANLAGPLPLLKQAVAGGSV